MTARHPSNLPASIHQRLLNLQQNVSWMHRPYAILHHDITPLVRIRDLDIVGPISYPSETNAPLVVDADAGLPRTITFQFLQSISWRRPFCRRTSETRHEAGVPKYGGP